MKWLQLQREGVKLKWQRHERGMAAKLAIAAKQQSAQISGVCSWQLSQPKCSWHLMALATGLRSGYMAAGR